MSLPDAAGRDGSASESRIRGTDRHFPRTCRLTARRQFLAVQERGSRVVSSTFRLYGLGNGVGHSRLGMTVTRKVGGAVVRNRVKRMLREIFRYNRAALAPSLDVIIVARPGIQERTREELEKEILTRIAQLVRRIGR